MEPCCSGEPGRQEQSWTHSSLGMSRKAGDTEGSGWPPLPTVAVMLCLHSTLGLSWFRIGQAVSEDVVIRMVELTH